MAYVFGQILSWAWDKDSCLSDLLVENSQEISIMWSKVGQKEKKPNNNVVPVRNQPQPKPMKKHHILTTLFPSWSKKTVTYILYQSVIKHSLSWWEEWREEWRCLERPFLRGQGSFSLKRMPTSIRIWLRHHQCPLWLGKGKQDA